MKNNNGITLISLALVILLLFVLVGLIISTSINSIEQMRFNNFKAELEEVQKKVNEISSDYTLYQKTNPSASYKEYFEAKSGSIPILLKDRDDLAKKLLEAKSSLETNKESDQIFYFTESEVQTYLGLKGIKDVVIDFSTRNVYSVNGCRNPNNKSEIYYCAEDFDGSTIAGNTSDGNQSELKSSVKVMGASKTIGSIEMFDIELKLKNYITIPSIYKVYYSIETETEQVGNIWTEIKDFSIDKDEIKLVLYKEGFYKFKVVDSKGTARLSDSVYVIDSKKIAKEDNEIVTNMHYIDGRVFYSREITLTTAAAKGNYDTNIQIDGIDNICFDFTDSYLYTDSGHTYSSLNTYYSTTGYLVAWYDNTTHHIMYGVGQQYINSPLKIVVRYTKIADRPTLATRTLETEEQFTGMYTDDGKKIYSISKETTAVSNANSETDISIPGADKVFFNLDYSYIYNEKSKCYISANTYYSSTENDNFWFNTKTEKVQCLIGSNTLNSKVFLTIHYTKKDDTTYEVSKDSVNVLSDQEVFTGKYINGKKVYRITKKFTTGARAGSYTSTVSVPNADIVMIDRENTYLYADNGNTYTVLNTYFNGNANCQCWFNVTNKSISYILGSQYVNAEAFITLQYTKVGDNETVTDMHYIDGRVFYSKEITIQTAPTKGNYDTNVQIDGIDNVCFDFTDSYLYTDSGNTYASLNTYYSTTGYLVAWYDNTTHHIMYGVGQQYINSPLTIVVRYTKIDDKPTSVTKTLSTEEQFTGMYTDDGKKIYSISKETTAVSNSSSETDISIPGADKVFFNLDYSYIYNEKNKCYISANTYYSSAEFDNFWFNTKTEKVQCSIGSNTLNSKVFLTIHYTKKDDTTYEVSKDSANVLSDQEVFTGKYINGKKVYRVTKKFTTGARAGSYTSTASVPNADIIMIDRENTYLYADNGNTYTVLNTYFNGNANCQCWFNITSKVIQYILGSQYVNAEAFITLQYTKINE